MARIKFVVRCLFGCSLLSSPSTWLMIFLLIIVVSLLFMSMLREWIMILILTQKGGCDCRFVISYCLLLLMSTLIPLPGYIPSFPDVKRETERERERLGTTVEKFDASCKKNWTNICQFIIWRMLFFLFILVFFFSLNNDGSFRLPFFLLPSSSLQERRRRLDCFDAGGYVWSRHSDTIALGGRCTDRRTGQTWWHSFDMG